MSNAFTILFIIGIIVFFIITIFLACFTRSSLELPTSLGDYSEYEDWLFDSEELVACLPQDARLSYERAKGKTSKQLKRDRVAQFLCMIVWQERHPPDSVPTDITSPQLISIQENGISAFEFEPEPDANVYVAGRTELQFMHGECCVQTNLPLPRHQEVYYWEVGGHCIKRKAERVHV